MIDGLYCRVVERLATSYILASRIHNDFLGRLRGVGAQVLVLSVGKRRSGLNPYP